MIPQANFELKMPYINSWYPNTAVKTKLFHSNKIEVRKSPLQGYGVFTKEDIENKEILEECHYITVEEVEDGKEIVRYLFNWPKGVEDSKQYVLALGFGSIYNTTVSSDKINTDWETDVDNDILVFYATKDIKKDTELLVDYNY
jgi:hypothetical protein|tara:strand:+ start:31 stop:462 length:432 start_codon:yes stop_codon:yes gene_type:complete